MDPFHKKCLLLSSESVVQRMHTGLPINRFKIRCQVIIRWEKCAKLESNSQIVAIFRRKTKSNYICISKIELQHKIMDKNLHLTPAQQLTKGQLISECPLGVFRLTKKQRNFFKDFCPSLA